jgi:hypothetical protein
MLRSGNLGVDALIDLDRLTGVSVADYDGCRHSRLAVLAVMPRPVGAAIGLRLAHRPVSARLLVVAHHAGPGRRKRGEALKRPSSAELGPQRRATGVLAADAFPDVIPIGALGPRPWLPLAQGSTRPRRIA